MVIVTVLVVVFASLLITRVGAVALTHRDVAGVSRFQARSAFFGVGVTTNEAEAVVGHPVRRRIIAWLIILGNAGVVSVLGTLVISFGGNHGATLPRIGALLAGLVVLALLASSRPVDRVLTRAIRRALARWSDPDVRDWSAVLELEGGYDAYLGAPDGDTVVGGGDVLTLYGREERIAELDRRVRGAEGDAAHTRAVHEQDEITSGSSRT
jgi:hypothetical protein